MKYFHLIVLLTLFISSSIKAQESFILDDSKELKTDVIKNLDYISDSTSELVEDYSTSSPYSVVKYNDNWYVISKSTFHIKVYDRLFKNLLYQFGRNGRGPGEGKYIQSYSINNDRVILFDSSLNKLIVYSLKGQLLFEKVIENIEIPYHITDLAYVKNNIYLAVGITRKGWAKLSNQSLYENIFLLEINDGEVKKLDESIIFQDNIIDAVSSNDVIASNVTSPFKLSRKLETIYLHNMTSNQVFKIRVENNKIIKGDVFYLLDGIFKTHMEMPSDEFYSGKGKSKEWAQSGNFFIDIFENSNYIFFYTSEISSEPNGIRYFLTVLDKNKKSLKKKIIIEDYKIIREIDDLMIHTYSFDNKKDSYTYNSYSLSSVLK